MSAVFRLQAHKKKFTSQWIFCVLCMQALLNNSYLYHLAHGKDFESRGIESKRLHWILKGHFI